jgi:hypothetical protein
MNRAQYLILCRLKRDRTEAQRDFQRLWKLCEDPKNQHWWDDMKGAEGLHSGLDRAVLALERFIMAGKLK